MKTWFPLVAQVCDVLVGGRVDSGPVSRGSSMGDALRDHLFAFCIRLSQLSKLVAIPSGSLWFLLVVPCRVVLQPKRGLDVLHGADRPKAEIAQHLGGLEIWFFLCPVYLPLPLRCWCESCCRLRQEHARIERCVESRC